MITEPKWKSYIVETTQPIFTPEQCKMIIAAGRESLNNMVCQICKTLLTLDVRLGQVLI